MTETKQQIQTNLIGKSVMLTEEAKHFGCLHSRSSQLWTVDSDNNRTFVGDFAEVPGGEHAVAEVVSVYLSAEGRLPYLTVRWHEDGSLECHPVSYFRVTDSEKIEQVHIAGEDFRDQINRRRKEREKWEGWYITRAEAERIGPDLVSLSVRLCHTDGRQDRLLATLHPNPVEEISGVKVMEYGGPGTDQQSVAITVDDAGSQASYSLWAEVDCKTGQFKQDSLQGWEED